MHLGHIFTVVESRPEPVAILQGGSEPAKMRILQQVLKKQAFSQHYGYFH